MQKECFYCLNMHKAAITHRVLVDETKPDDNNSYVYFHTQCMDNVLRNYIREKKQITERIIK